MIRGTLSGTVLKIASLRTEVAFLLDDERGGIDHSAKRRELLREIERLERGDLEANEYAAG